MAAILLPMAIRNIRSDADRDVLIDELRLYVDEQRQRAREEYYLSDSIEWRAELQRRNPKLDVPMMPFEERINGANNTTDDRR